MKWPKKEYVFMPMILVAVVAYSYSLAKLLALSEIPDQLHYPGLWFSVGWSLAACFIFASISWIFLARKKGNGYSVLEEETSRQESSEERERISTPKHVGKLLSYCKRVWFWFTAGFIFLIIYALGK